MSIKIGNYIHYTKRGYDKHGITLRGEKTDFNFGAYHDSIINRIEKIKNKNDLSEIQSNLNKIFGKNSQNLTETEKKDIELIWQEVEKQLFKQFENSVGKINRQTGDIEKVTLKDIDLAIDESISSISTKKENQKIVTRTIISRIRGLEKMLNSIEDVVSREKLQKDIDMIYSEMAQISKYTERQLREAGLSMLSQKLELNDRNISLVKQVNKILKFYNSKPSFNTQKGALFEFLIAYSQGIGKNNLQETMKKFASSVKGNKQLEVLIDPELFEDYIDFSQLSKKRVEIGDKAYITLGTSQQKIDVLIEQEDGNEQPLKISAKNVNLFSGKNVHLVSGSPLITLIQQEDPFFVNHYLNITAQHPDKENDDLNIIKQAHNAMKVVILYKALTGDLIGRESANIFIYNNNKTGEVTVVDIYGLFESAIKDIENNFAILINDKIDLSTIRYSNRWSNIDAQDRISKLILSLHQLKIYASLTPSLLLNKN